MRERQDEEPDDWRRGIRGRCSHCLPSGLLWEAISLIFTLPRRRSQGLAGEVGGLHVFPARDKSQTVPKISCFQLLQRPRDLQRHPRGCKQHSTLPQPSPAPPELFLGKEVPQDLMSPGGQEGDGSGIVWEQEQGWDCPDCSLGWNC